MRPAAAPPRQTPSSSQRPVDRRNRHLAILLADDEPREWWRMTASPMSATVVGALFLLQAVTTAVGLVRGDGAPVVRVGVAVGIVVAAAYFHSAIRRSRRHLREAPAS